MPEKAAREERLRQFNKSTSQLIDTARQEGKLSVPLAEREIAALALVEQVVGAVDTPDAQVIRDEAYSGMKEVLDGPTGQEELSRSLQQFNKRGDQEARQEMDAMLESMGEMDDDERLATLDIVQKRLDEMELAREDGSNVAVNAYNLMIKSGLPEENRVGDGLRLIEEGMENLINVAEGNAPVHNDLDPPLPYERQSMNQKFLTGTDVQWNPVPPEVGSPEHVLVDPVTGMGFWEAKSHAIQTGELKGLGMGWQAQWKRNAVKVPAHERMDLVIDGIARHFGVAPNQIQFDEMGVPWVNKEISPAERALRWMSEHPYQTNFTIDAIAVLAGPLRVLSGMRWVAGRGMVPLSQYAQKRLAAASAAQISKRAATDLASWGSLGLGATYIAETMRKNPEASAIGATLVEVFGPVGVFALFTMSHAGVVATLARMKVKNEMEYFKLSQALENRHGELAVALKSALKEAAENSHRVQQMTTDEIFKEIAGSMPSPATRALEMAERGSAATVKTHAELVRKAIHGEASAEIDAVKRYLGLRDIEHYVGRSIPTDLRHMPAITQIDDVAKMVAELPPGPEYAALLRQTFQELENLRIVAEAQGTMSRSTTENLHKLSRMYKEATKQMDVRMAQDNWVGLLNTEQGIQLLRGLPKAQKDLGFEVITGEALRNLNFNTYTIHDKTVKFLNTHVREAIEDNMEYSLGVTPGVWDVPSAQGQIGATVRAGLAMVETPKSFFGKNIDELVKAPQFRLYQDKRVKAKLGEAWDGVVKPLNKGQRRELDSILWSGNDTGQVYRPTHGGLLTKEGGIIYADPAVVDAYFGARAVLDYTWNIGNDAVIMRARQAGIKLMGDNQYVQMGKPPKVGTVLGEGQVWTREMADEGMQVVEIINPRNGEIASRIALTPEDAAAAIRDIPRGHRMLDYHEGYMPIHYAGKWDVVKFYEGRDGKMIAQRVVNADKKWEAEEAIVRLMTDEVEGEAARYMAVRSQIDTAEAIAKMKAGQGVVSGQGDLGGRWTSFVKDQKTSEYLKNLPEEDLMRLVEAFEDLGVDPTVMRAFTAETTHSAYKGRPWAASRADERKLNPELTEKARLVPTSRSMEIYFGSIAKDVTQTRQFDALTDKFAATAGKYLENPNRWDSPVDFKRVAEDPSLTRGEAVEYWAIQQQLKNMSGMKTARERAAENWIKARSDELAVNPRTQWMATALDGLSDVRGLAGVAKGMTATAKFGFWAIDQFAVQASGVLMMLGKTAADAPQDVLRSTNQFRKYVMAEAGIGATDAETKFIRDMIERSGYLRGSDYQALTDMHNFRIPIISDFSAASTTFFRWGNTVNRGMSFMTEMNALNRSIRAGTHPTLKPKDIGSHQYLEELTGRADILAFNMNAVNQPMYSRGWAGVEFQFLQFASHSAENLFGANLGAKGLTRRHQIGMWGAWLGAFGLAGVPFAKDVAVFGEQMYAKMAGKPEMIGQIQQDLAWDVADMIAGYAHEAGLRDDVEFWRRAVRHGPLAAVTEGRINFAHRAGVNAWLNSYYDGVRPENLGGAASSIVWHMIDGSITTFSDISEKLRDPDQDPELEDWLRNIQGILQGVSAPRNVIGAIRSAMSDEIRTPAGRLIMEGLSFREIMSQAAGMPDTRVTDIRDRQAIAMKQNKYWRDWSDTVTKTMRDHVQRGNFNAARDLYLDGLAQVYEHNPTMAPQFAAAAARTLNIDANWSVEDQQRMERLQDMRWNPDYTAPRR
jgi:hypothetical protein